MGERKNFEKFQNPMILEDLLALVVIFFKYTLKIVKKNEETEVTR